MVIEKLKEQLKDERTNVRKLQEQVDELQAAIDGLKTRPKGESGESEEESVEEVNEEPNI
jgi:uncharacterized protein YlxW (UPF0749 family)